MSARSEAARFGESITTVELPPLTPHDRVVAALTLHLAVRHGSSLPQMPVVNAAEYEVREMLCRAFPERTGEFRIPWNAEWFKENYAPAAATVVATWRDMEDDS